MPYPRFTKLIVKYVMSKNDKIPKRPPSSKHLKVCKQGTIDLVFGMPNPAVLLNDDIKTSAMYLKYLKKAVGGSTPVVKGGKRLLSKKGVEIVMERLRVPKRKRSKTSTEDVYESEQMDDLGDSEETEDEEVKPLVRHRSTDVTIGSKSHRESVADEQRVDHSMKLKGLETLSTDAQLKLDMKKAQKPEKMTSTFNNVQKAQVKDLA
ncbi:hypothetical protein Tco_1469237 [Tanacetum coccineum]